MEWLRRKLAALLERLRAASCDAAPAASAQLAFLEAELARLEADEAALHAMLSTSKDSFHHALAASTTAHRDSLRARRRALRERIARLRAGRPDVHAEPSPAPDPHPDRLRPDHARPQASGPNPETRRTT